MKEHSLQFFFENVCASCHEEDEFYQLFITKKYDEKKDQALILEYVMEYECLKTYCHILLSNKNFAKINNTLSSEWGSIKNDIE